MRVTIAYPCYFDFKTPKNWDELSFDEKRDLLFDQSDLYLSQGNCMPIITDCEEEDLID